MKLMIALAVANIVLQGLSLRQALRIHVEAGERDRDWTIHIVQMLAWVFLIAACVFSWQRPC